MKVERCLVIISLVLALSCGKRNETYTISDEKLSDILTDLHFAETTAQNEQIAFRDSIIQLYFSQVYKIHKVDSLEIDRNIKLLKNDPERLATVYELVLAKLKKKEAQND